MHAFPNGPRQIQYGAQTMMGVYSSGMLVGDALGDARSNGLAHVGSLLPLGVGVAAGAGVTRALGGSWPLAIGIGMVGMAVMSPFAFMGGLAGAIGDAAMSGGSVRQLTPEEAKLSPIELARKRRLEAQAAQDANMLAAKSNGLRREGTQAARPNLGALAAQLIGTGIQAGAAIGSSAISASSSIAGLRAQNALAAQQAQLDAEMSAADRLAQQSIAASSSDATTQRTKIIAGSALMFGLAGLAVMAYRMSR